MKFLRVIINVLIFSTCLQAYHDYDQIIIPGIDIENPYWEFAYQPIHQNHEFAFLELVEKWNTILQNQWHTLDQKIIQEVAIDIDQLVDYLDHPMFISAYMNFYEYWYPDFFNEESSAIPDPLVLNFLHLHLCYLNCNKPVYFYTISNIPLMTTSFGSNKKHHYLIVNNDLYHEESIKEIYQNAADKTLQYQIFPSTYKYRSTFIEELNLLHCGIAFSLSNIIHQSDLLVKLLSFMQFADQPISDELQKDFSSYLIFLSYIESTLQSKNPVEIALYLQPQLDNIPYNFSLLWQEFIQDIKDCYDQDDLKKYEQFSQEKRLAILYQNHSNE